MPSALSQSRIFHHIHFIRFTISSTRMIKPAKPSLQAIFEPMQQALWAIPIFFIRLPAPPSHFWTKMPSAMSQSRIFHQIHFIGLIIRSTRPIKPAKPYPPSYFWTDKPSSVSQSHYSSSDSSFINDSYSIEQFVSASANEYYFDLFASFLERPISKAIFVFH